MNRLLILTASTGEGHNQAANSLKELFETKGYDVTILDFFQANSKLLSKIFVNGYAVSASFLPKLYGALYKISDIKILNKLLNIVFIFINNKILKFIDEYKPTAIVTTHPLAVSIIDSLKSKGVSIPVISIVTDFKAHYSYISQNVDLYITGSDYTNNTLISRGIDKNKICALGIPVKNDFKKSIPDLLDTRDNEFSNILLMGGSMGLNQISHVLKELLTNTHKLRITVVCGNNKSLKEDLLKKYTGINKDKKLHILGFSRDVSSLMDYSDLIITKPGGLTVTEAISKKLPLVIPFAIPGQEIENTDFLVSEGYAIKIDNLLELNHAVDNLLDDPNKLNLMKNKLSNLSETYSTESIYSTIETLIKEKSIINTFNVINDTPIKELWFIKDKTEVVTTSVFIF